MTVLELNEFLKAFEEEFGVTAAAPVAVAAVGGGGGGAAAEAAEEKDEFDVVLVAAGDKKIQVIKVVRELTSLGPQGGQGPGRRRPEAGAREGVEGRRREGQGQARGVRRHRRAQVAAVGAPSRGKNRRPGGCQRRGRCLSCARNAREVFGSRHSSALCSGLAVSARSCPPISQAPVDARPIARCALRRRLGCHLLQHCVIAA